MVFSTVHVWSSSSRRQSPLRYMHDVAISISLPLSLHLFKSPLSAEVEHFGNDLHVALELSMRHCCSENKASLVNGTRGIGAEVWKRYA